MKKKQSKAEELAAKVERTVATNCEDPNTFAVILEGDSMEPRYIAGDMVVFAPNAEPRNGRAVVAKLKDGRVFFRMFHCTGPEGSRVRLESVNPNYAPIEFPKDEIEFIYPAFELIR